jgi:hypothetical protein
MDLLVVEELKCSSAFRSWLFSKMPLEFSLQRFLVPEAAVAVRHSVDAPARDRVGAAAQRQR